LYCFAIKNYAKIGDTSIFIEILKIWVLWRGERTDMIHPNIFSFFAETQVNDVSFAHSLFAVAIFLSIFGFCGYMIVRFCKRGSFARNYVPRDETKKSKILDNKFLYGRKYITLVECCGKCSLILVNRDNAVKLSEREVDKKEVDR
jgi:hypothetical protein